MVRQDKDEDMQSRLVNGKSRTIPGLGDSGTATGVTL